MVECQVVAGLTWGTLILAVLGFVWLISYWLRWGRAILQMGKKENDDV